MKVRVLKIEELEWWYDNFLRNDFPENERKPLSSICRMKQDGKYDVYLYEEGDEVLGYATIWRAKGRSTCLLDYLGVPESFRNKGVGGKILRDIRSRIVVSENGKSELSGREPSEHEPSDGTEICLVLESETPLAGDESEENEIRKRRVKFYERNHYVKIYEMGTCGVRFDAMAYEKVPDNLEKVMREHKEIYGPKRTDVIVPLPEHMKPPQPFWMETVIRKAAKEDLPRIMEIEREAFPKEEAAEQDTFRYRLEHFGDWFYVAEKNGVVVGNINGRLTDKMVIDDILYEPTEQTEGEYFALLSVETASGYRRQAVAESLIDKVIEQAKEQKLQGIILACKTGLIPYYEKFGFEHAGISSSVHGGAEWHDMILKLNQ